MRFRNRTAFVFALVVSFTGQSAMAGETPQTIVFGAQGANVFNPDGESFDLNPLATASSGLAVTYSSLTQGLCTVSGSAVSIVFSPPPGTTGTTCTIAADQGGDADFAPAPQVTQSISVQSGGSTAFFDATAQVFGPTSDSSFFTVRATGPENLHYGSFGTCPAVPVQCSSSGAGYADCRTWIDDCVGGPPSHLMEGAGAVDYLTIEVTTVEAAACGNANGMPANSAPSAGLCNVGTPSVVFGAGPWTWSCIGDGNDNTASCAAPLNAPATATTLTTACMTTFVEGQPFTFAASVSGATPTGTVTFLQDTTPVCADVPLSSGIASCSTASLSAIGPLSPFALSATYAGDANNAQSTSATLPIWVLSTAEVIHRNGFDLAMPGCPEE